MKDLIVNVGATGVEIVADVYLTTRWCQMCPKACCAVNCCLEDAGESAFTLKYEISGNCVHVRCSYEPRDLAYLGPPRVGMVTELKSGMHEVEWFGRGPHESYRDRYLSAKVGKYKGRILDQTWKYVRPQENGNKWDTRWMKLSKAAGDAAACRSLLVKAETPSPCLAMQCHRYALKDFEGPMSQKRVVRSLTTPALDWLESTFCGKGSAVAPTFTPEGQRPKYGGQLAARPETTLCIDAGQNGLGCVDAWSPLTTPLPQYVIGADESFEWAFSLHPIAR